MTDPLSALKVDSYRYLVLWAGPRDDPEAIEFRFGPNAADDPRDREIWQDWLRRHSVDPNDVAVPGWIRRNRQQYRVEYLAYALDEHGRVRLTPDHTDAVREPRFVQLEGPPLPFPPIGPLRPPTTPETETP